MTRLIPSGLVLKLGMGTLSIIVLALLWASLPMTHLTTAVSDVVNLTRSRIHIRNHLNGWQQQLENDQRTRIRIQPWIDCLNDPALAQQASLPQSSPFLLASESTRSGYWAYRPLTRETHWIAGSTKRQLHPIDALLDSAWLDSASASHAESELPDVAASRLLRRLWWETLGVPPTVEETDVWVKTIQHDFSGVVDHLLQDPRFGEHQATFWLDLVRYADSNGYEEDEIREHAFPYRDFVIWAFNSDLPYDAFVRWQLAGDELAPKNPIAVAATGYLTAAPYNTFIPQPSERWDELDSIVSTTGRAFLGTTVGCARCHDHPYDPISIDEYYAMVAIFSPTQRDMVYLSSDLGAAYLDAAALAIQYRQELHEMMIRSIQYDKIVANEDFTPEEIQRLRQPVDPQDKVQTDLLSRCGRCLIVDPTEYTDEWEPVAEDEDRYQFLMESLAEIEPHLPAEPPQGLVISGGQAVAVPVLHGGSINRPGPHVQPGFPNCLTLSAQDGSSQDWTHWTPRADSPRPRSALAHWMTDTRDGAGALLARVIVNRIWQQYFGKGLVTTTSDFGGEGQPPQHPELLECLASELVAQDWSLKSIHRLILTSGLYRQARQFNAGVESEPSELHVRNFEPRRLTAEMFYDSLLVLGGNLNPQMYGPAYQPQIPFEAIHFRDEEDPDATWPTNVLDRPAVWRRAVYAMRRRSCPIPLFQLLDAADRFQSAEARQVTTVPTQMLLLMNDSWVKKQVERMEVRVYASVDTPDPSKLVDYSYQLVLGRLPTDKEREQAVKFVQDARLSELIHALLLSHEYWYIT